MNDFYGIRLVEVIGVLVFSVVLFGFGNLIAREGTERSRIVLEEPAVLELKEKYPRELRIVTKLSERSLTLGDRRDGSWVNWVFLLHARGGASCMKHIYGEDGVKVLKAFNAHLEDDKDFSPEECFTLYGVNRVKVTDLGI